MKHDGKVYAHESGIKFKRTKINLLIGARN